MEVIKLIKSARMRIRCEYPNIDINSPVEGLDEDIQYYEVVYLPVPNHNPKQFDLIENTTLTDKVSQYGDHLKIAEISYILSEKEKSLVLGEFNESFGKWIDNVYPLWQRVKDISNPTQEGDIRQSKEMDIRDLRQSRENDYLNKNIFPDFKFEWL